jgi:probable F420-dependent oxidoreductase
MPRPFRFGVLTGGAPAREAWLERVRQVEDLGYSTLVLADHVHTGLAPLAAMVAAAEATTTLRIGSHVFANDFRNPVLLAKEAASIDLLSGGRLELGLGTGFWRVDYDRTGIALDPPGVRVSRFAEAVQVIKRAFDDGPFSFAGTYYTIRDLDLRPKPVQRPRPPIVIGGGGRRMISLAAREADIVSIGARTTAEGGFDFSSISPEAFEEAVAWVRQAAGARADTLELSVLANQVEVSDEGPRKAAERQLVALRRFTDQVTVDQLLASPKAILGTVDDIVETLLARRRRYGLSYIVISGQAVAEFAPIVARLAGK